MIGCPTCSVYRVKLVVGTWAVAEVFRLQRRLEVDDA